MPTDGQTEMVSPFCVHLVHIAQRTHNNGTHFTVGLPTLFSISTDDDNDQRTEKYVAIQKVEPQESLFSFA
jgi:hypothetical protein